MSARLAISIGQHSDKGRKEINQDFHGAYIPNEPLLSSKGICIALADGISSSDVSQIASESAVTGFLADYYSTSEAWSVKTSAQRVLMATNSWLHSQTQRSPYRYDRDKGYVCTFSAMIIKSSTAHLFHAGDSRIYRLHGNTLEQLTNDHRLRIAEGQSYLSQALGISSLLDLEYRNFQVEKGDIFILATDGVYEHITDQLMVTAIRQNSTLLGLAARQIAQIAFENGSNDNLTVQIVRVDSIPERDVSELYESLTAVPFPPLLEPRMRFDGFRIIRQLHASSRSHVYLAVDEESETQLALKTPSIEMREDTAYLERFLIEEWIARRIDNPHVLKPCLITRKRNYLYVATEYVEGQTLTQWMRDNPAPSLETVRALIEQIARGVQAFHRLEMLHQDLRPDNILIDRNGTVKIIDFGSARVAGLVEATSPLEKSHLLGTAQYAAPEYFLGEEGSVRSDVFSLGIIAYQLLTGRLPYGAEVARCKTRSQQDRLKFSDFFDENRKIPRWVNSALKKAVEPNPLKRYEEVSEFVYDLRHPNKAFLSRANPPIAERNPLAFWKGISAVLLLLVLGLLMKIFYFAA
jgi:serine/threonine protein phosphatase PrpC